MWTNIPPPKFISLLIWQTNQIELFCPCIRTDHTSYVAEWRGGGPHDLLRGFDSFRNCKKKPAMPVPKFYGNNGQTFAGWCFYTTLFLCLCYVDKRRATCLLLHKLLIRINPVDPAPPRMRPAKLTENDPTHFLFYNTFLKNVDKYTPAKIYQSTYLVD